MRAVAMVHDQRLGCSQAFGGSGGIHRGITAAVHDHTPAEAEAVTAAHTVQKRHGIDDVGCVAHRNVDTPGNISPNRSEDRIEASRIFFGNEIADLMMRTILTPISSIRRTSCISSSRGSR